MKTKVAFIILAAIIAASGTFYYLKKENPKSGEGQNLSGYPVSDNAIYVSEQKPGKVVLVSLIRLEKPGFVAVHEDNAGSPGKIIGSSELISAGEAEDTTLIQLSHEIQDGEIIYAMLHSDDGDGVFNPASDQPIPDKTTGESMIMIADVSVDAADPGIINY